MGIPHPSLTLTKFCQKGTKPKSQSKMLKLEEGFNNGLTSFIDIFASGDAKNVVVLPMSAAL